MSWLDWLWMLPLGLLLSPLGAALVYVLTGSYIGLALPLIGLCIAAAAGAGDDGYD